ncbi:MAG: hypothetical protein QNJ62_00745 [Methyloceanibacter sp.]|nr:hypothetical protein [Methyloceanibacter sp.]
MSKNKWALRLVAAMLTASLGVGASHAADWAGTYMTEDTKGNAFKIALFSDATARGEKEGHVLDGSWSADDSNAVIKWTTGWTTKLSLDGGNYKKTAYRPGAPTTGEGRKTTPAKKVE